jgi:hypothetical protein
VFAKRRVDRKEKSPGAVEEYNRTWRLKKLYGLTVEQFEELRSLQNNRCKICGVEMLRPNVDHNHQTGKVRGLLCNNCNRGLGHLKDSIPNLLSAVAYLKSGTDAGRGG